jgi:hypothetical protein
MKIKRICKICGKSFTAIKVTQFFCCRKCFKRDYYLRTRNKINEEEQTRHYPIKTCGFCSKVSQLSFDPLEDPDRYDAWSCPHCGTTNALLWKYDDEPNSHQIIKSILVTFQTQTLFQSSTQYQTYKLPILNLEKSNPGVIVMTCDALNILDIQKKNRRKLSFS